MMEKFITKATTLIEALPYLQKYRGKLFVFKYGGHAMSDEGLRESFLRDIILLKHVGIHPIIVHGGGPQIEEMLKKLGITSSYHNGLRITDSDTMKIVEMVLVGGVNSELVSAINKMGGNAVGFTGGDGNLIQAKKMGPQKVRDKDGKTQVVDLGFVGEVTKINPQILTRLVYEDMFIPVISPVGVSVEGESLNINADTAACELAIALKAEKLIYLTDVHGIKDSASAVVPLIKFKDAEKMIEDGVIQGGMIPKVNSALYAIKSGVGSVVVTGGQIQHSVLLEIFTDTGVGTLIL